MAPNDNIAIAAAFLAGFHRMMTLLLNLNGSFLTLLRFGISPSKIGCFIGDTGSCMQFWNNWGILLSFGLTFCGWTDASTANNKPLSFIAPIFSTVIYCLLFAYTWYVKKFSGEDAVRLFILVLGLPIAILFVIGANDKQKGSEAAGLSGQPKTNKLKECKGRFVCPVVSILSSIGVFVAYCMLSRVCRSSHGNEGVRKLFFWLCASAFAYQFDQCIVTKVNGAKAAWFFLALELYGPLLPLLHWLAGLFGKRFGFDVESAKLVSQIGMMIAVPFFAVIMWIAHLVVNWDEPMYMGSTTPEQPASESLVRCLSPGFIGAIGLGSCFWLFPVVFPFMVCHFSHFQFVMFFCPFLGASATLIVWFLNEGNKFLPNAEKVKPVHRLNMLKGYFSNWNGNDLKKGTDASASISGTDKWINDGQNGAWFHASWGLLLFIIILFKVITSCVHYPRCFVARSVLHSRWAVFWGSWLYFLTQLFKAFGLTGVFANAIGAFWNNTSSQESVGGLDFAHGGTFGTVSVNFALFHMTASFFTTQAYSVGVGSFKCAVDSGCSWPTQGLGGVRSFWWWLGYGLKIGTKRFRSLADVDIISVIS